jgi:hypothetical protein
MASLLSIHQSNPNTKVVETDRLYYNKFTVKLVFNFNDYRNRRLSHLLCCLLNGTVDTYFTVNQKIKGFDEPYRTRQEFNIKSIWVSVFLLDIQAANRLVEFIKLNSPDEELAKNLEKYISKIERPFDTKRAIDLAANSVFRNKKFKFEHKVTLAEGKKFKFQTGINGLVNEIEADTKNFSLAEHTKNVLFHGSYIYSAYYYCNNLDHLLWITLQCPSFIKKVQKVVRKS